MMENALIGSMKPAEVDALCERCGGRMYGQYGTICQDCITKALKQTAAREGPGSMSAAEDDTTRQRELAVLEAAKAWRLANPGTADLHLLGTLAYAVDALTAPEPVDPQTLEPGTRFRFSQISTVFASTSTFKAVRVRETGNLGYVEDNDPGQVYVFTKTDSVIPLPEDTE